MKKTFTLIILLITYSVFGQDVWTIFDTSNSDLTFNQITDIEFDSQGNKWITSNFNTGGSGIAKFDDTNWTIFSTENQQGTNEIHRIKFTTGTLENWVSVYATTIVNFADGTQTTINSNHDNTNNILIVEIPINATNFEIDYYIENYSTVEMEFYNVATSNILHQETFTGQMNYEYDYAFYSNIFTNQVIDISIDNLDNKWIGTWQNGLMKFDDINWINYTAENSGLPNNNINCVATDNDNNVWIGTSSGLTKFDGTNWTTYNSTNSDLPNNSVVSIAIDENNHKWISTNLELVEFDNVNWNIYGSDPGNWFGSSNSIIIDNNNTKWLSSGYGIKSFDGTNWEYFNYLGANSSCLLDCQISCLTVDLNNDIWVGAYQECSNAGLLNFTQCVDYFTTNSYLPENGISAIKIDNLGNKWIGTFNGLAKLETETLSLGNFETDLINVYPNPITDKLTIKIKDNLIGSSYSILNNLGQVIKKGKLKSLSTNISFKNIKNGIFYFKLTKSNELKTYKIIK